MKVAVLGTGRVGTTLGSKLIELGHEVRMGSREAGNAKAVGWVESAGSGASQGTFADAAEFGEIVINATSGLGTLPALEAAGRDNLAGKTLIDISNPLDFSRGMPPSLFVGNTDSLAEQIQRAFPEAKVVKALNTVTAPLMVAPRSIPGDHVVFIGGDDAGAKEQTSEILKSFGWPAESIVDLGDITAARAMEAYLLIWVPLMMKFNSPMFNIALLRPEQS